MEWKTPTGSVKFGSVAITAEMVIGKLIASLDKTATPWSLVMKDPIAAENIMHVSWLRLYSQFSGVSTPLLRTMENEIYFLV